jgi:predicted N-acyltransferase
MQYEHKVRKNVKRAQAEGISVERDVTGSRLDEFLSVYYSTMERRCANESYLFPREFFLAIINGLSHQYAFFNAIKQGRIVSSELVLVSERHLYSFLGGTLSEAFACRPNDLIKHSIIKWGLELGKSTFVLGGGYGSPDGIFRFKRSFAPDGEREFYIGKSIWNEQLYASITDMRRTYEAQSGRTWMPKKDFFPAYRG